MGMKLPPSFSTEVLKAARLGSMQASLPTILKVAPAAAIFAGAIVARATGRDSNLVEERLLGETEGVIALGEPSRSTTMGVVREKEGVRMMCVRCEGFIARRDGEVVDYGDFKGFWTNHWRVQSRKEKKLMGFTGGKDC